MALKVVDQPETVNGVPKWRIIAAITFALRLLHAEHTSDSDWLALIEELTDLRRDLTYDPTR